MTDPLSITAGTAGLLSLGIQVTESLFEFYTLYKSQDTDVARITDRLENLLTILRSLDILLQIRQSQQQSQPDEDDLVQTTYRSIQNWDEVIRELEEESKKFSNVVSPSGIRSAIETSSHRAAYPFRQSTLQKLEKDVGEIQHNLSIALDVLHLGGQKMIHDDIAELKQLLERISANQVSSAIRDWLNAPDATINYNTIYAIRYAGIGMWFIRGHYFTTWLNKDNSFLWLNGFAGCGKSVLCSTAIQHTFRQRQHELTVGIAFFYFTFSDETKQDDSAMIRALLLQLAGQLQDCQGDLARLYNSYQPGTPPVDVLVQYLQHMIRRFKHVYILLDALDESPRYSKREGVLAILGRIREWCLPGLHLLVTSRDEPDIRESLSPAFDEDVTLRNDEVNKDISNFVSFGHEKVVQKLLEKSADVNAQGGEYGNALQTASFNGHQKVVQSTGSFSVKYLVRAIVSGQMHDMRKILCMGINVEEEYEGERPLLHAIKAKNVAAVRALREYAGELDVETPNKEQQTPLMCAASQGDPEMVVVLLSTGANIDGTSKTGVTPLMVAARMGHLEVAIMLLNRGANCHLYSPVGWNAFHYAVHGGGAGDIIKLFAQRMGVDSRTENKEETPLLILAILYRGTPNWEDKFKALLDEHPDVNKIDVNGNCPLSIAIEGDYVDLASRLIARGAKLPAVYRHKSKIRDLSLDMARVVRKTLYDKSKRYPSHPTSIVNAPEIGDMNDVHENRTGVKTPDDKTWIYTLEAIGYDSQEVHDILSEQARDFPWIYFEPTDISHFDIQNNRHIPRCCHRFRTSEGEPLPFRSAMPTLGYELVAGNQENTVRAIEELCGVAGISPKARKTTGWIESAEFSEKDQGITVTYSLSYDQSGSIDVEAIISRISRSLEGLSSAVGLMQAKCLCCDSFTVIKCGDFNPEPDSIAVGDIVDVSFQCVVNMAEALAIVRKSMDIDAFKQLRAASADVLGLFWRDISEVPRESDIESCLRMCALSVQFLCLGFLSYIQAHTGPIQPFFLEIPLRRVTLLGIHKDLSSEHLVAELTDLTCLANMTRAPVMVFYSSRNWGRSQTSGDSSKRQSVKRMDIKGHVCDILDTWGPGNLVFQRDITYPPVAIQVGGGYICAGNDGKCHWAREFPDAPSLPFVDLDRPILIGALTSINEKCNLIEEEWWRKSAGMLEYLGTGPSSWTRAQRQIGTQGGQYIIGQYIETWNKQRGVPVKDVALAKPDEDLIQYMDEYWGIQLSYCTGVARRVLLRTIIADLIPLFTKSFEPEIRCFESRMRDTSVSLKDLYCLLDSLGEGARTEFLSIIRRILDTLRATGLDLTEKYFCVAWPFQNDTMHCFKIPLEAHSSWAKILADSHDCATFAYITMQCLETDEVKCSGSPEVFHHNIHLLETTVTRTYRQGSTQWTLRDEEVCFFSKLDNMFWVKVRRARTDRPARLVELMFMQAIPRSIRQRLHMSERKKQRGRLRECSTGWVQGEIVSVSHG